MEKTNADYEKELCRGIWGTEFTYDQLKEAFETVQNPTNWKAPIGTWIPIFEYELMATAVKFFTATDLIIEGSDPANPTASIRVTAKGYQAGPAGDH